MRAFLCIFFLILFNIFTTVAWYSHLRYEKLTFLKTAGLWLVILVSWGIAFFDYIFFRCLANRRGDIEQKWFFQTL